MRTLARKQHLNLSTPGPLPQPELHGHLIGEVDRDQLESHQPHGLDAPEQRDEHPKSGCRFQPSPSHEESNEHADEDHQLKSQNSDRHNSTYP